MSYSKITSILLTVKLCEATIVDHMHCPLCVCVCIKGTEKERRENYACSLWLFSSQFPLPTLFVCACVYVAVLPTLNKGRCCAVYPYSLMIWKEGQTDWLVKSRQGNSRAQLEFQCELFMVVRLLLEYDDVTQKNKVLFFLWICTRLCWASHCWC